MKKILVLIFIVFNAVSVSAQDGLDTDALVKQGFEKIQNKDLYQEALEDFNQVIALSPTYTDAYIGKAMILKKQGKWQQAKEVLIECSGQIKGDLKAGQYLAETAWQEGFYRLARQLDREYPLVEKRKLMEYENEINLGYGYDWVENRSDWWELNFTYLHRIREDQNILFYYSDFKRPRDNDFLFGLGYVYKWDYRITFALDSYFSDDSGFTAQQKYRPRLYMRLPYSFTLGVGGNFDEFSDGWSKVSHTELVKYFDEFYGKYTLLAGDDNLNQSVTTHIGEIGYEKENKYTLRLGYSTGNESIDRIDRFTDGSVDVDSYFVSGKYFITTEWGLNISVINEYRDNNFFRTSGSSSLFYRF